MMIVMIVMIMMIMMNLTHCLNILLLKVYVTKDLYEVNLVNKILQINLEDIFSLSI